MPQQHVSVSAHWPKNICFRSTGRGGDHWVQVLQNNPLKMPVNWHLSSKDQRCEISNQLQKMALRAAARLYPFKSTLSLKEAAGPFSIAQNSLTWSLLCALDSRSFYHCCHFPGHSFITYIKASGWCTDFSFIYVDNSCIFHVLCSDKTVIQQSLKLAHFPSVLWKERDI